MKDLLIGTSGCGGGNGGPSGVYHYLGKYLNDFDVDIYSVDTIPNSVEENVKYISKIIIEQASNYRWIYLAGWSMGGATVIQVAHYINNVLKLNKVRGIVLLATQGAGTKNIQDINVPILFIHGDNDRVLSHQISERMHSEYTKRKKLVLIKDVVHNFLNDVDKFANIISNEVISLFNLNHKNYQEAVKNIIYV